MSDQFSTTSLKNIRICRIRSSPNFSNPGFILKKNELGMNVISELEPNSPSERSGLDVNDLILKVNDQSVVGERLAKIISQINFSYKNGFVKLEVSKCVPFEPITPAIDPMQPRLISIVRKGKNENIGFELKFLKSEMRYVARNVHQDFLAYKAGLRENDSILQLNGDQIYQMENDQASEIFRSLGKQIDLVVISDLDEYYRIAKTKNKKKKKPECSDSKKSLYYEEQKTEIFNLARIENYDGYGFSLKSNEFGPQMVAMVEPNSPSEKAGLKSNDLIIKINQENVADIDYFKLLNILQSECKKRFLEIEVLRPKSHSSENQPEIMNKTSSLVNADFGKKKINNLSSDDINLISSDLSSFKSQKNNLVTFSVKKDSSHQSLGIKLGLNGIISSIDSDSPAYRAGLKENQRLVEVNGVDFRGKTNKEIANFIKDKKDLLLRVEDKMNDATLLGEKEKKTEVKNDDDENKIFKRCVVSLNPEYPEGFGFTLNPEIEPKFTIFTVETDSPAYAANLRASDVIVEIDKKNIRRSEFEKVKSMILQSKKNGSVEILAISKQAYLKLKSDGKKLSQNLATNENTLFYYDKKKIKKMNLHLCEFDVYEENLGFSVASLKSNPGIFRVTDVVPGSSAAISNLKDNDLIVEVSGTNAENLSYDDLIALLQKKKCERNLKILIRRD